jgi:hypothetical protein
MRQIWIALLLLLHVHAAFCNHQEIAQLDTEIDAMKASLELQQARLLEIEAEAQLAREEIRRTSRKLEFLGNSRKSMLYNVRLEPVLIAPNSDFPQHSDFIYVGLHLVFSVPQCGCSCNSSCIAVLPGRAQSCDEVRLHVLEKLHPYSAASSSTQAGASALGLFGHPADEADNLSKDRVQFSLELGHSWQHEAPSGAVSVSDFNAHLCVVLPEQDHVQYQAAVHVIGNFRCRNETFDPTRPWASAHRMPFHDFRQRVSDGFWGKIAITVNSRVHALSPYAFLLGGAFSRRELVCSMILKPNLCDDESLNLNQISSPLFSSIEYSGSWDFKAPASSAANATAHTSFPCSVAVVWTFWSDPPPFEMDWLSELIDLSGCSVTHFLDLQMRCRGSVFSDSTFTPDSVQSSKVFVVSHFPKDWARGFGAMESCMAMWKLDGFASALVHFGDDGNAYSYFRYPKLDFVLRNHPSIDLQSFINVIPLGLGYKIKFWPSALRNISLRRVARLQSTTCSNYLSAYLLYNMRSTFTLTRLPRLCRHRFVDALTVSHRKFSVSFAGQLTAKSRNRAEWVRVAGNCRSVGNRSAMFKETTQFNDPAGLATDE